MGKRVAKVIVRAGDHYLFSRKRAPGKRKDGLLELIGGGLRDGEAPFAGLLREAGEEEVSGTLAGSIAAAQPGCREFDLEWKGDVDPHSIYEIDVPESEAALYEHDPRESRGFERVPRGDFESDDWLRARIGEFTSKTRAILRALGREV